MRLSDGECDELIGNDAMQCDAVKMMMKGKFFDDIRLHGGC